MTRHGVTTGEVGLAADTVPEQLVVDRLDVADQDGGACEPLTALGALVRSCGSRGGKSGGTAATVVGGGRRRGDQGRLAES